jgi:hypothetical protein
MFELPYSDSRPAEARRAASAGAFTIPQLPIAQPDRIADRYGDVALGVESAWPTGISAA